MRTSILVCLLISEPVIVKFPSSFSSKEGEEVRLQAKVEGHPAPTFGWYHDGVAVRDDFISDINWDTSLSFPCVERQHSGEYKLIAINSSGQAERVVTLTVLPDSCASEEDGGSAESNSLRPVPVDAFGQFVTDKHANGNKEFDDSYKVGSQKQ